MFCGHNIPTQGWYFTSFGDRNGVGSMVYQRVGKIYALWGSTFALFDNLTRLSNLLDVMVMVDVTSDGWPSYYSLLCTDVIHIRYVAYINSASQDQTRRTGSPSY